MGKEGRGLTYFNEALEILPPAKRKAYQLGRLKELLVFGYENSSALREKFEKARIGPKDIRTLKDLEKISGIFIRLLTSIYHSRITYPKADREDNHHKSTGENSHQ